ncbi:hypothetical protein L6164_003496 [Bauhinia variegata]|uniref:Uncharacterized protein n=1 Tax=Bauhinia variegata TaxID=167791 RepID=A0ACB9Q3H5_BAUVA|nr:hypothetical protein L6164_003496 [Bauhinia variegata]
MHKEKNESIHKQFSNMSPLLLLILFSSLNVGLASGIGNSGADEKNPFNPRAFLMRYWDKKIHNKLPKPAFLLSKASPLSAVDSAAFAKLAATNTLSTRLTEFCSSAHLLCIPELGASLEKHTKDVNFAVYQEKNFTNYGTKQFASDNSFKNYSADNAFRRYSRDSQSIGDKFKSYGPGENVVDETFNTYGTGGLGGEGNFKEYTAETNVPNLQFTSYSGSSNGRESSFSAYSEDGNAGEQEFTSYGKKANGADNEFTKYGTDSNVVQSTFTHYGEVANGQTDNFTNYGINMNNPTINFKAYGDGSNGANENFANYRDQSNVGDDSFSSYAKKSNGAQLEFKHYGKSFNEGTDKFTGYGKDAKTAPNVVFKDYGVNNTFKGYNKDGVTFAEYTNASSAALTADKVASGSSVKRWVEPGKFFREKMLKQGTVMPMPDIKDKMPGRSFLPRSIVSKLPFSSSKISELKQIFKVADNSSMDKFMKDSFNDCGRAPSPGETKRCVASIEDMIDFATSVLGPNIAVRSTENVNGSKKDVMVGSIKGINGGKVTKSVSCHQSMFPYMVYYCHSVPKVRVYEADLLDPKTKAKINHGVAICHLDTTAWSPTHGAFLALGSGPGRIEVCHWIFENDMTWTIAD